MTISRPHRGITLGAALLLALTGCAGATRSGSRPGPDTPYDLIIDGGRVVDGTGAAWFHGDVAIRGDRIARITHAGALKGAPAKERLDARGMVVAPGFIDIQSHSRSAFLTGDSRVIGKVTQGVTTEIMGESETNAPLSAAMLEEIRASVRPGATSPASMPSTAELAQATLAEQFAGQGGFDRWFRLMEGRGASANFGSFVGATTIRRYGKGRAMGAASAAELDSMRAAVRWAMEEGAFGVASALVYPPGNFASTEELIEVVRASAPYGGVYITHMRSEGDDVLGAMDEAIRIGREGGVPVEIYHLKAAGVRNHGKASAMIAKIDSARRAGLDVQADMYPYVAGGTGLSACLPPAASEGGRLVERLRDPAERARIKAEVMGTGQKDWEEFCALATPENVLLVGFRKPENRKWVGKRLSEVAKEMNKDWFETVADLLVSDESRIETLYFLMSEDNVKLKLRQPWMKFGTDAGGLNPDSATGMAHPRSYGTFTRILGKYVRDEGVMPLEEAVRKMTSAVTTRLGIEDRGVLRAGMRADVVVFDPATVGDRATFEKPHQLSVGVREVLVNGTFVVRGGAHTGAKPGVAVRGAGWNRQR